MRRGSDYATHDDGPDCCDLSRARRQDLDDAHEEGRMAGTANLPASACPYLAFEPEYRRWHDGRLETLPAAQRAA